MANQHWHTPLGWTVNNYTSRDARRVCHEHFEESCFEAELQTRLGFRKRASMKLGAVPTIFNYDPARSPVQREKKRLRSAEKRR